MTEITVTTTLDTTAILALYDTPLALVAAPGAGKILIINDGWVRFDVGTTPASASGNTVAFQWSSTDRTSGYTAAITSGLDTANNGPFFGGNSQLFSLSTMAVGSNDQAVNAGLFAWTSITIDPTGITDLGTAIVTIIYEEINA